LIFLLKKIKESISDRNRALWRKAYKESLEVKLSIGKTRRSADYFPKVQKSISIPYRR